MTDSFHRFDPDNETVTRNGVPVTRAMIDDLASRAERDGIPTGLISGGKSLSGGNVHSPRIQVVLSATDAQKAKERALRDGMSVSKWARRVILDSLDEDSPTTRPAPRITTH